MAAFAGLNPSIMTSGTSVKREEKISKIGNKLVRKIHFFSAMAVMRFYSSLKQFVKRLRVRGKKGKAIIAAVMQKLLHIIFGILKTQTFFQD